MKAKQLAEALAGCRIASGKGFRLRDHDTTHGLGATLDREEMDSALAAGVERLSELQPLLAANDTWALLCVLQAMDAAGKDGTIQHVMSGVNPAGVQVTAFKVPGPEDLAHDFLWRIHQHVPPRGMIGIFNRSHYEEVLAVRVHPAFLERQKLPEPVTGKKLWQHRLDDIAHFERYLDRQGVVQLKFFLNVSRAEQKRRFLDRLDHPDKNWKFSAADIEERAFWDKYMDAYEEAIIGTADEHAPWYVIPADNKRLARLLVIAAIVDRLEALDLRPVRLAPDQQARLEKARTTLNGET